MRTLLPAHRRLRPTYRWLLAATGLLAVLIAIPAFTGDRNAPPLPDMVDYNFHIRPILSNNCYVCHGPDISSREAGLRLDTYEGATALLENGEAAIVPRKPGKSPLIHRISSEDPEMQMPPPSQNKRLSDYEVALFEKWIRQGATYKPHWAFIPPQKPAVPRIKNRQAARNDIDAFILNALEEKGLQPAPEAEKPRLLRRLSYVLTGLPPAPEALEAFVRDSSGDAYERQVDRLLASPHFGERWARHWMDLVRYAETRGHEFDYPVGGAEHYRDYLIRAFNADVPYDQLVREHMAGDLIETPRSHPEKGSNESIYGTAFLTMGEGKHSPVDIAKEESDILDNMIDITSKTFQGLTVSCAKCHDHKFDPIPTADYYALYGILKSARFTAHPAAMTAASLAKIDSISLLKTQIRQQIAAAAPATFALKAIDRKVETQAPPAREGDCHKVLGDFRLGEWTGWYSDNIAFGDKPLMGDPVLSEDGRSILAFQTGKASSRSLAINLPGALRSPTFNIEFDSLLVRAAGEHAVIRVIVDNFQLIQWPIFGYLQQDVKDPNMREYRFHLADLKGQKAYVEFLPGTHVERKGESGNLRHRFRQPENAWIEAEYVVAFEDEAPDMEWAIVPATDPGQALADWAKGEASAAQVALLNGLLHNGQLDRSAAPAAALIARYRQLAAAPLFDRSFFTGFTEGDAVNSPVFIRGNHLQPSDTLVPHRFFTALPTVDVPFEGPGSHRLAFADALLHPENPLTARVMVNRLWHHLFGRGIVETVDNFGAQGTLPSHPELLDYLAARFVEEGWSVKQMIRMMALSATFRQATHADAKARAQDPQNLLLHHYPLRRLEAEAIRDAMLAVSDCLDPTLYGEPVPVHLTEFMKGRGRPRVSGPLDGEGRRSIYTSIRRNFLPPMMLVFDMPTPFSTFGRRNASNVPAQSLTLLNDPFVIEQAHYWAVEVLKTDATPEQRIEQIFLRALSRLPDAAEVRDAMNFLHTQARAYACEGPEALNDLQVWQDYCHAVFNFKEFIHLI